jgi:S1-C subfamily serine protease
VSIANAGRRGWIIFGALILGLAAGHAQTIPTDEASAVAFGEAMYADLARIAPSTPRLGGTLLVILPPPGAIAAWLATAAPSTPPDKARFQAEALQVVVEANVESLGKARIFDSVRIVRLAPGEASPGGDETWRLALTVDPLTGFAWTLRRGTSGPVTISLAAAPAPGLARLKFFDVAVLDAAVDLGAPIPRQPQAPPAPTTMSGSGFFFAPDEMLTNSHVVQNCTSLKVMLPDGAVSDASIMADDPKNDLAALLVPGRYGPIGRFRADRPIRQGEDIIVYGYALAGVLSAQGNLSIGIVSALSGFHDDARQIQISAPIQPGNSGGPVLDASGAVVAIAASKLNALGLAQVTKDIAQNVNFAIKAEIATAFLRANGLAFATAPPGGPPRHTEDVSDAARTFTYMIQCRH